MRAKRSATKVNIERSTVAYVRVSSDQQVVEGMSLEAQEARLRAYAGGMGWELADVVVDAGLSAKTIDRPGLQAILAGLRNESIGAS